MRTAAALAAAVLALVAGTLLATQVAAGAAKARPDLVVRAVSGSPNTVRPGAALTIKDTVANTGNARASTFTVGYYLTPSSGTKRTGIGSRKISLLKRGKSSSATTRVTVPAKLAVGSYRITACADSGGTVRESSKKNNCLTTKGAIHVKPPDRTAPVSKASAPAYSQSGIIPVDYTARDADSSVRTVELWVRGPGAAGFSLAEVDSTPGTSAHHFDYRTSGGDGQYAFYTRAFDSAGNAEAAPASPDAVTTVDLQPPVSTASAVADSESMSIAVGYVANGTGSPLDRVELWVKRPLDIVYSKAQTDFLPAESGRSFNYTAVTDGSYAFYTVAFDKAGNPEPAPGAPDATTFVDTHAPTTTDNVPSGFVNQNVSVTLTANDGGGSGVDKTYYEKGASPATPTTSSPVYDPSSKPVLANGERIKYFSTDLAGNTEAVHTSPAVQVDTGVPTTTDNVPSGYVTQNVTVTLAAADTGGSGLDKTYYTKGANPADPTTSSSVYDANNKPVLTNGQKIKYFSTDKAGNAEPVETSLTAQVDSQAPSTTDNVPSGFVNQNVSVTLTATDQGPSGLDKTYYEKGANPANPTTGSSVYDANNKPELANGEKIKYFSTDNAGNAEAVHTSSTAQVDTVAPSTTDNVPSGFVNQNFKVTLNPSDSGGSGLDKTYYAKGANPADPTTSSSVYDANSKPVLANGEEIKYFSTDKAGNAEAVETSSAAQVDTAAPSSTASAPSTGTSTAIQVGYTATETGGSGLAKVELWVKRPLDSAYSKALTDSSPAASGRSFGYTADGGDGTYSFYTLAYDNAGNAETAPASPEATTTIDTAPPSVTIDTPTNNSTTDLVALAGHTGTAATDVQSVTLKIYPGGTASGTVVQTPTATVSNGQWSASADPPDPGTYTLQASQQDSAGNTGTAASTFTVPTTVLAAGDIAGPPRELNGSVCQTNTAGDGSATTPLIQARSGTVLALGDNEYEDCAAGETQTSINDYNGWFDKTWGLFKSRIKPVPGNHEYPKTGGANSAPGYFGYFDPGSTNVFGSSTTGYYSYDMGNWHIVALNSNSDCLAVACSAASTQGQWLTNDLAGQSGKCILAYWHHPVFSSSQSSGSNNFQDNAVRPLFNILYNAGADIILNGHQHNYERFAQQDANGNATAAGVREFVAGTGGRSHRTFGAVPNAPNTQFQNDTDFGILDLTLGAGTYSWSFWPASGGAALDPGSASCHHQPPPGP